jgi:hypothetical protein
MSSQAFPHKKPLLLRKNAFSEEEHVYRKLFFLILLTLVLGLTVDTTNAALVAHWKFDEGSGATANDSVGGNHATLNGATWTTGQIGGALRFDGVNDYLRIPDSDSLDITGDLTIRALIKTSQTNPDGSVIFSNLRQISPNDGYSLDMTPSGNIRFFSQGKVLFSIGKINTGTWKNIVVALSGNTATIYIDGLLDNSGTVNVPKSNDVDQTIGASYTPYYFFNGIIDDVQIYNHAIPESATLLLLALGSLAVLRRHRA